MNCPLWRGHLLPGAGICPCLNLPRHLPTLARHLPILLNVNFTYQLRSPFGQKPYQVSARADARARSKKLPHHIHVPHKFFSSINAIERNDPYIAVVLNVVAVDSAVPCFFDVERFKYFKSPTIENL